MDVMGSLGDHGVLRLFVPEFLCIFEEPLSADEARALLRRVREKDATALATAAERIAELEVIMTWSKKK